MYFQEIIDSMFLPGFIWQQQCVVNTGTTEQVTEIQVYVVMFLENLN